MTGIKKELNNPLVLISIFLIILTFLIFINNFLINPFIKENEKKEVSTLEKKELEMLTISYLKQNKDIKLNKIFKTEANNNQFNVAAQYYYLKNGQNHLDEYDEILSVAKKIFNNKYLGFSNFEINIDEQECGKEKYTTLDGIIYNDACDLSDIVYEILDVYEENEYYVVEFYAAKATQSKIESSLMCEKFERPLSYKLAITNFDDETFYDETKLKCCLNDCNLEGIEAIKSEIINQIKSHGFLYKMIFKKVENYFEFSEIKDIRIK